MKSDIPVASCAVGDCLEEHTAPASTTWLRVGIALVVAGQTMVFSLAISMSPLDHSYRIWLHAGLIAASLLVMLLLGKPMLTEAWRTVRQGRISVDQLFILSVLGAFIGSLVNTVRGVDEVYYELVAILLAIYTVGKTIGARSREKVWREWSKLEEDMDQIVRRGRHGEETVRLQQLRQGDHVILQAGGLVPVDGVIVEGQSYVRETFLDGSLEPRAKQQGDSIYAGGVLLDGHLVIRVERSGEETEWARIRRTLLHYRSIPSRWQHQADQIMQWFLPIVCLVSVCTFLYWWQTASWDEGLFNSMAVLLVACPCAMGLATPLALWNGMAQAARYGVIVQSGDFLHELTHVRAIVWDKTGTLGSPQWELQSLDWEASEAAEEVRWKEAIYLIEQVSRHPLALTLRRLFADTAVHGGVVEESRYIAGEGVKGVVRWPNGERWNIALRENRSDKESDMGNKRIAVYRDDSIAGILTLSEKWVDEALPALQQIHRRGIPQYLYTGDRRGADQTLEPYFEEQRIGLTPSQKATAIAELQKKKGAVLYLGDGLNDLAAMQQAEVSIAVGDTLPIVQSGSKALLRNHRLGLILPVVDFATQTGSRLKQNLVFAGLYNLAGVSLAATGLLSPIIAALLMVGASAVVSGRALALIFKPTGYEMLD